MWLITNLSPLGCDTRVPLSDYFRASADSKSVDPDVFHRSVRLDQPTATPVLSLTPKGSHSQPTTRVGTNVSNAPGCCACKTYVQLQGFFLMLSPKTLFSWLGPLQVGQDIPRQNGATIR